MPQSELTVVPTLVQDQQCDAENHEIPEKNPSTFNSNNIVIFSVLPANCDTIFLVLTAILLKKIIQDQHFYKCFLQEWGSRC